MRLEYVNRQRASEFPIETAIGSMAKYITDNKCKKFPANECELWIISRIPGKIRKKQERNEQHAKRALETIQNFMNSL